MGSDLEARIRHVTAVLGPTNTGKTHLAIERMLGHQSGMIGLPLRLLAREVYDKIAARVGADNVALVTGEEKIKPETARYWVATVEAMPRDVTVDFLAVDEIQLAADPERGHVFTDRLLHARGRSETLLLGAATMRDAIADLVPGANFISRPRLSKLSYAGEKKITRLPQRSAVIAFSAAEVYSIAELIRRQRGGAAVVLGALSPRTRNAQVALYQSGDVDFLVATDAIGMGLNLDVDHVAFSATRKFDGQNMRNLTPSELAQIAGRAGRHMNDGSFGVTGGVDPFDSDLIERLETHTFDSLRVLQWRGRDLDFGSLDRLRESLRTLPNEPRLTRARMADDVIALETVAADREIEALASSPAAVMRLWDVCQVPDYRKISSQSHSELVATLYKSLMTGEGVVDEDWFTKQVALSDRIDGDIDTLSTRLAHIRTWTFVANRADWLRDPVHWQGRTRAIEDTLSDALHELLTQRFVDRRTSALMKGMRDKEELAAEIADDGAIHVEQHYVGRLKGFRFSADAQAEGVHGKAARSAASQVLSRELAMRARRVAAAKPDAFKLDRQGRILWRDEEIGKLEPASDPLKPTVSLFTDEHIAAPDREKVQLRLDTWVTETVADKLKPLVEIARAEDISGLARGIAFRLVENFGVLKRDAVAEEIKSLDQDARAQLRKYGVRFGAFNIYFPTLLKPAAADLCVALWRLKTRDAAGADASHETPRAGLTSTAVDPQVPEAFYRASGFHVCGPRAVRIDILERLADLVRPLVAFRSSAQTGVTPPAGSTGDGGFIATPQMMSILGCSPDELGHVFRSLGFRLDRRPVTAPAADTAAASGPTAPAAGSAAPAEPPVSDIATVEAAALVPRDEAPVVVETTDLADAPPNANAGAAAVTQTTALESEPSVNAEATTTGDGTASDAATVPAQRFEDVWRPRRARHERRPSHGAAADGPRSPDRRRREPGRGPSGISQAPIQAAATNTDALAPTAEVVNGGASHHAKPERGAGFRGPPRDRRPQGGHGPGSDRRPGPDRDRDRKRGNEARGPNVHTAAPPSKGGKGGDSDSPFAALGALRLALEQRSKSQEPT